MENRENDRYIVLANVDGRKTAIQLDGLYTILPPQDFPSSIPEEIQYRGERLPLYDAGDLVVSVSTDSRHRTNYEQLYRDLLARVKEISDEVINLKRNLLSSVEKDLTQITTESIPAASGKLSSILSATETAANNIMDLTEQAQESQTRMMKRCSSIKEIFNDLKKGQEQLETSIEELEGLNDQSGTNLTNIVTSLSFQDLTGQKMQQVVRLQEALENKLISILFNFGIKLRREENPEDESIKRGEEMLDLLEGEERESINQDEVDQLLSEFLR